MYGIGRENDEYTDGNEQEESRTVCSRTRIGVKAAFLKEFPQYSEYDYNWQLNIVKIAVMCADLPHVVFKNDSKKKCKADDRSIQLNLESLRKAEERRRSQQEETEEIDLTKILK